MAVFQIGNCGVFRRGKDVEKAVEETEEREQQMGSEGWQEGSWVFKRGEQKW